MKLDPFTMAMMGIQAGTSLYNTFGKNNPAKAAGNELGKIQGYGREAYNPFIQQGQQAQQQMGSQYGNMASNPMDFYNQIMQQYQPSAGYQHQAGQLNQLAHNKAAAGGYAGTGGDIFEHGGALQGLMGQDMQKYLENIFGIQSRGQQGLENQVGRGFQASGNLADYLGDTSGAVAGVKAYGQDTQNANRNQGLSSLADLIGSKDFRKMMGGGPTGSKPLTSIGSYSYNKPQSNAPGVQSLFGSMR